MTRPAKLKIQKWGNSLAVRIPSSLARSAGFKVGQPVELSAQDRGLLVTASGEPELTLAQKLALFDPKRHGGEAMAAPVLGLERI
jgi:antitoxin MazE